MRAKSISNYFSMSRLVVLAIWGVALFAVPYAVCYFGWLPEGSEFIPFSILLVCGLCIFLDNAALRVGIILVGLLSFLYLFKPDSVSMFLDGINYRIQDASFRLRGPIKNTRKVVIVDIDGDSLSELGQWPFPRNQVAAVAQEILDDGALSLGFDVVFAEPDRMSVDKWLYRFEKMGLDLSLEEGIAKDGEKQLYITKDSLEDIVFLEWEERLKIKDPYFEIDEGLSVEDHRKAIIQKYKEERQLELKKQEKSAFIPESDEAVFLEMTKRSRELFVAEVDWSKDDPFNEPLPVVEKGDAKLANTFQDGRMVAGGFFVFSLDHNWFQKDDLLDSVEHKNRSSMVLNKPVANAADVFTHLKKANYQVLNIPTIQRKVVQQGAFNIVPDASGAARYYSHLVQAPIFLNTLVLKSGLDPTTVDIFDDSNYEQQTVVEFLTYPSLTLTMLRVANDYDAAFATQKGVQKGVQLKRGTGFEYKTLETVVTEESRESLVKDEYTNLGDQFFIPLDFKGDLLINFLGEGGRWQSDSRFDPEYYFPYISFSDVLQRNFPKGFFRDKYVILGSTDPTLFDLVGSPFRAAFPGLEVHATMLDNMISQRFLIDYGDAARLMIFYAILIIGTVLVLSWVYSHFWFAFFISALTLIGIPWGSFCLFKEKFIVVEYIYIWLALAFTSIVVLLINYFVEGRERRFVVDQFSSLVSKDVLKKLKEDPKSISLEGSRAEASIFFSDLAGFTTFSEKLSTQQLVRFLNNYFSPMTEIITKHQGFIDKFIGDAIMAVWGVPFDDEKHAEKACLAALDQQKQIDTMAKAIKEEHNIEVYARMGIASGEVAAAMTGSPARKNYTVLGDVVNLGARLEPACKDYGVKILISENTYKLAKNAIEARCLDKIVVKGKTVPIAVYELMSEKGNLSSTQETILTQYEKALHFYWDKKWEDAQEILEKLLEKHPEDLASEVLLNRVISYKTTPPPTDWQGEFVRTVK